MAFSDRLRQAGTLVTTLQDRIWSTPPIVSRLIVVPYGYETHIPEIVRTQLRFLRTTTSRHVRFTPDFFVIDRQHPERMYLLEYKVTQTPVYSQNRIASIGTKASIPRLRWQDLGQMEADAYDNYMAIQSLGVRVVVLDYCAYHERPLLCDFVERIQILHRDVVTTQTIRGSRTPFVNFNCASMRDLKQFLRDEHGLDLDGNLYSDVCRDLAVALPVEHHIDSPLHPRNQRSIP